MAVRIPPYAWMVILLVAVVDLIAFGLAIAGEVNRSKPVLREDTTHYRPDAHIMYCKYTSTNASGFGVGAMICLLFGHLAVITATKSFFYGFPHPGASHDKLSRELPYLFLALVWLSFTFSEFVLLVASVMNAVQTNRSFYPGNGHCKELAGGFFSAGAASSFLTMVSNVALYVEVLSLGLKASDVN